jgi:hypothetical protein
MHILGLDSRYIWALDGHPLAEVRNFAIYTKER